VIDFMTGAPVTGSMDVEWIHGAPGEPAIQVHYYDEHTVILRQGRSVHWEAPFLFLLFGNDRALLLDTGAVRSFFGFGDGWPDEAVQFDLGGRRLDVLGSPGHHPAAITVYDPWTGIMFTGDTVLPGRLYVSDLASFAATMNRLVAFTATRPVTHVLGCHVEMTGRPGRDFPLGAAYQPGERTPQMTVAQLCAVRDAALAVATAGQRGVHPFDDFIIYGEPRFRHQVKLIARGLAHRLRPRRLEPGVDRLGLQGQHGEDALVHPP
jgi:hydroxyacylglutathione hydrolase